MMLCLGAAVVDDYPRRIYMQPYLHGKLIAVTEVSVAALGIFIWRRSTSGGFANQPEFEVSTYHFPVARFGAAIRWLLEVQSSIVQVPLLQIAWLSRTKGQVYCSPSINHTRKLSPHRTEIRPHIS